MQAATDSARLSTLKERAATLYQQIQSHYARFSCGESLADHITGDGTKLKADFNGIWEQIRTLDPSAPPSPFA